MLGRETAEEMPFCVSEETEAADSTENETRRLEPEYEASVTETKPDGTPKPAARALEKVAASKGVAPIWT